MLDSIDEAIERTEEVIAATERLRDALLHELLTRGVPGWHTQWHDVPGLGTIPANWQPTRLGRIARFVNGRAFRSDEWRLEGLPIVRIQNLTNPDAPYNFFSGEVSKDNFIDNGDIVISWSATLEVMTWQRGPAVLNQHIFKVDGDEEVVGSNFLYHLLSLSMSSLRKQVHGTTMKHITKGAFESTLIGLPPAIEQRTIAAALDSAEAAIVRVREESDGLHGLRASLTDVLLTGRVRVVSGAICG